MVIKFDGTTINNDYIFGLHQDGVLFSQTFILGSTLCRSLVLDVYKSAVTTHPTDVDIYDDASNQLFSMIVDSVDDTNTEYYRYQLVDRMILGNKPWSNIDDIFIRDDGDGNKYCTGTDMVDAICDALQVTRPAIHPKGTTKIYTYDSTMNYRDYLRVFGEMYGGYVWITPTNQLQFMYYSNTTIHSINLEDCSDIALGEQHIISRVVFDSGIEKFELGDTTGDTVYLSEDNWFITDNTDLQQVYDAIVGFTYYPVKITNCLLDSLKPGDVVNIIDGTNTYPTIVQANWDYMDGWYGGLSLNINSQQQEETKVSGESAAIRKISSKVDRTNATLTIVAEDVKQDQEDIAQLQVSSSSIAAEVTKTLRDEFGHVQQIGTYMDLNANGLDIHGVKDNQATESFTRIADGKISMNVDASTEVMTITRDYVQVNKIKMGGWIIEPSANDDNVLNFFYRGN